MARGTRRQNEFEPFSRAQFKLILAGPLVGVASGKCQFGVQHSGGVVDKAAVVARVQIEKDVAGKQAVFVADHGRPARKREGGQFADGHLRAARGADQHAAQAVNVAAKIALVADVDGIALAPFDVFSHVLAADARRDGALHVFNRQAVARGRWRG